MSTSGLLRGTVAIPLPVAPPVVLDLQSSSTLRAALILLLATGFLFSAQAQESSPAAGLRQEEGLRVFIDCPDYFCDLDSFRTEINWISHVRDRQDAQVHVLVTTQRTGAGGSSFTLSFIGKRDFRGVGDTLRYLSRPDDSEDQIRRGLVQVIKRGLVRYVNQTPFAERLEISYAAPGAQEAVPSPARDPWNGIRFTCRAGAHRKRRSCCGSVSSLPRTATGSR